MEFNEKLQELRKSKSLTQEELAEALFVSRTAISKWEQGRGYPSIDSLKEISRFFSVSIDDLICSEEIISAAADEKKECVEKYISLICNTLDIFLALLLFLPVFGNGTDHPVSVSLYAITGLSTWIKTVFAALISLAVLNGICGVIINHFDKPVCAIACNRMIQWIILSLIISIAMWTYIASEETEEFKVTFRGVTVKAVGEDILRGSRNMVITNYSTPTVDIEVTGPRRIVARLSADDLVAKVDVTIFSDNLGKGLHKAEFDDFCAEYGRVQLKKAGNMFHDRYIVLDYDKATEKIYHCGASSKDGGNRVMTIEEVSETAIYHPLILKLLSCSQLVLN